MSSSVQVEKQATFRLWSRMWLVFGWLVPALAVALYAILKPSPDAGELMIPSWWADWLNKYYDIRTMLLTLAVASPAAWLLRGGDRKRWRLGVLAFVGVVLLAAEFAQIWIPTRGFGWPDVGFTCIGIVLAGLFGITLQRSP